MKQLEAVLHAARLQLFEAAHDLGDGEAELRSEAARRLPASAATSGQLDAHADLRPYAELLRSLDDQPELGVLLHDRDDVATDLVREHRRLDELGVLEAVADDRCRVVRERDDGQELRLRAGLEAEVVWLAELVDFLDDLSLLIDLDRVDAAVAALVLMLCDGAGERGVDVAEAVLEDVGEANQHREADASELESIDQFLQVDRSCRILCRVHLHVTGVVHRDIAIAPARHFIQLARLVHAPCARRRGRGCERHGASVGHSAHERDDKRLSVVERALFSASRVFFRGRDGSQRSEGAMGRRCEGAVRGCDGPTCGMRPRTED